MKKNYVLDTNVLLHDPRAIFRFEDNDVIVPIYCIEEIDQFKREGTERGRNARQVARLLDELREQGGSLSAGVTLSSGGMLRVAVPMRRPELPSALDKTSMDQAILQTAFEVRDQDGGRPTIFVTMDTNLRIRADALGMVAQTYENMRVDVEQLDPGVKDVDVYPRDSRRTCGRTYASSCVTARIRRTRRSGASTRTARRSSPSRLPARGSWG